MIISKSKRIFNFVIVISLIAICLLPFSGCSVTKKSKYSLEQIQEVFDTVRQTVFSSEKTENEQYINSPANKITSAFRVAYAEDETLQSNGAVSILKPYMQENGDELLQNYKDSNISEIQTEGYDFVYSIEQDNELRLYLGLPDWGLTEDDFSLNQWYSSHWYDNRTIMIKINTVDDDIVGYMMLKDDDICGLLATIRVSYNFENKDFTAQISVVEPNINEENIAMSNFSLSKFYEITAQNNKISSYYYSNAYFYFTNQCYAFCRESDKTFYYHAGVEEYLQNNNLAPDVSLTEQLASYQNNQYTLSLFLSAVNNLNSSQGSDSGKNYLSYQDLKENGYNSVVLSLNELVYTYENLDTLTCLPLKEYYQSVMTQSFMQEVYQMIDDYYTMKNRLKFDAERWTEITEIAPIYKYKAFYTDELPSVQFRNVSYDQEIFSLPLNQFVYYGEQLGCWVYNHPYVNYWFDANKYEQIIGDQVYLIYFDEGLTRPVSESDLINIDLTEIYYYDGVGVNNWRFNISI